MSTTFNGHIRIGGPIRRGPMLEALAGAIVAANAAAFDWGGRAASVRPDRKEQDLLGLVEDGYIELYDADAEFGRFAELEELCTAYRIPFDRWSDAYGEFDAEQVSYRGKADAATYDTDAGGAWLIRPESLDRVLQLVKDDRKKAALRELRRIRRGPEPLPKFQIVDPEPCRAYCSACGATTRLCRDKVRRRCDNPRCSERVQEVPA